MLDPLQFFKALADETRLKSVLLIAQRGELCVCELTSALDVVQPKISRHLALLRKQQILMDRRQGQWVYYQLHPQLPEWAAAVLQQTLDNNPAFLTSSLEQLQQLDASGGRSSVCC